MNIDREMVQDLKALGFTLLRCNKHRIYSHPCGLRLTTSVSVSDHRARLNNLKLARRLLAKAGVPVPCT